MTEFKTIHVRKGKRFLFKIESSQDLSDFKKYEAIRFEIWGDPHDNLAGVRNLGVENYFHDGSNLLISIYVEDAEGGFPEDESHIVGFSYGYVGVRDKNIGFRNPDNITFYSQYIGVKKDYQSYRLGVLIKEFQKKVVLDLYGLSTILCTYDPLVGANAYRNIHLLRMRVEEYRVSWYQGYAGKLNRTDVASDRLYVSWGLKESGRTPEYDLKKLVESDCLVVHSEVGEIRGKSGPRQVEFVQSANPDFKSDHLLIEVPYDFYTMLQETDVRDVSVRRIPRDWRMATRTAFQELLQKGYRVLDFNYLKTQDRIRDFYIMAAPP